MFSKDMLVEFPMRLLKEFLNTISEVSVTFQEEFSSEKSWTDSQKFFWKKLIVGIPGGTLWEIPESTPGGIS